MSPRHNKEQILSKGLEMIRESGYSATGIQHILEACNIPKGSFYNFFPSKESFVIEVIGYYSHNVQENLQKIDARQDLDGWEKVKYFFQTMIDYYQSKKFKESCLLGNLANETAGKNPKIAEAIDREMRTWKTTVQRWIENGQNQGTITGNYPAKDLTDYIFDSFYGTLSRMKYEQSDGPFQKFNDMYLKMIQK